MTANEFIIWLKGFANAANPYNITPKQWDDICSQLAKVKIDNNSIAGTRYNLDNNQIWGVTNTTGRLDVSHKTDNHETKTLLTDNTKL
jgi:hypothetical protein